MQQKCFHSLNCRITFTIEGKPLKFFITNMKKACKQKLYQGIIYSYFNMLYFYVKINKAL